MKRSCSHRRSRCCHPRLGPPPAAAHGNHRRAGAGYALARAFGTIDGARIGLRGQDVAVRVRQQLGSCLVSSSALALGLTIQMRSVFPEYATTATGIVVTAFVIFEVIGRLLTGRALMVTGEARTIPMPLAERA